MCCQPQDIKSYCGCCHPAGFQRRFVSKQEEKETLEHYKETLEKELTGIQEKLKEL